MHPDEFVSWLRAWWESAGPWVPDGSLAPEALPVKRQFEAMLADFRLNPDDTRELPAVTVTAPYEADEWQAYTASDPAVVSPPIAVPPACVREVLGYSWADAEPPFRLPRTAPDAPPG
jgi:hypothetical protein